MDFNFDHQMSLSKSKYLYSNNCLHFLKRAVPLTINISFSSIKNSPKKLPNLLQTLHFFHSLQRKKDKFVMIKFQ